MRGGPTSDPAVTAELGRASEMEIKQCNLQAHSSELMFAPFTSHRYEALFWLGRTSDDKNDERNDGAPLSDVARITGCVAARHSNEAKEMRSQKIASDMLEMTTVDVTRIIGAKGSQLSSRGVFGGYSSKQGQSICFAG
jgi:hypothetical protein